MYIYIYKTTVKGTGNLHFVKEGGGTGEWKYQFHDMCECFKIRPRNTPCYSESLGSSEDKCSLSQKNFG